MSGTGTPKFGKANIFFIVFLLIGAIALIAGYASQGAERNYTGDATVISDAELPNNKSICDVSVITPEHKTSEDAYTYSFRSNTENCYQYTEGSVVEIVDGEIIGLK